MKVAIFGSKEFDSLEYHFNDSFKHLGHEVVQFDIKDYAPLPYVYNYWAIKFLKKYGRYLSVKIAKKIMDLRPDIVICSYRFIHPDAIKLLKSNLKGVPVVQLNPDALTTFEDQQVFASPYDAYFTKDPFIVNFMKNKAGLNAHYLPEAFNQRIHKAPNENRIQLENNTNIDVLAFGSMYPYRANIIRKLVDSGIKPTLFGMPDWRFGTSPIDQYFNREYITGARKSELLYGAKIVFNNFHYAEVESVNVKFFEISGIGGFQICDYKDAIKDYSVLDPKDFTFKTIDEAQELIAHYLPKQGLRHELAAKQAEHFLNHHTYDIRVEQMLKHI